MSRIKIILIILFIFLISSCSIKSSCEGGCEVYNELITNDLICILKR